jgi:hypothetical protein
MIVGVTAIAVAPCVPSMAADPPPQSGAVAVGELVVTARTAGPAWWRISRGDSVVWILGLPPSLPKGFVWNTRTLDDRLTGARQAITPAVGTAGLFAIPALLGLEHRMRVKAPLEDQLPATLRTRFLADAAALHKPPARYDHWNGVVAGLFLMRDFELAAGLDYNAPLAAIDRVVRKHGVKPRPAAVYKALDILRAGATEIDPAIAQTCLAAALDEVEEGEGREAHAAEGWARGDVAVALTASTGFERCLANLPEDVRVSRQSATDETTAIAAALQQPGVTVAFIPLRRLVEDGGVLRRLEARGFAVHGPDPREAPGDRGPG